MAPRRTLTLTQTQRQELEHHRDHDRRPWVRERYAALLKIADGMTPHAVTRHGLLTPRDPDTVYAWLSWYETHGFWSVEHVQQGGAHGGQPVERRAQLEERLAHAPGEEARQEMAPTANSPPPSRWTLLALRATFPWLGEMSLSGVQVARARIVVEHIIRRLRLYGAVSDPDRHHRRHHEARMCAVRGLVNRQIDHRCAA